jgi:hypothetical protein
VPAEVGNRRTLVGTEATYFIYEATNANLSRERPLSEQNGLTHLLEERRWHSHQSPSLKEEARDELEKGKPKKNSNQNTISLLFRLGPKSNTS